MTTRFADVRLYASVNRTVGQQAFSVREGFRTVETDVRLLSSVAPFVHLQLPFPMEALSAKLAQQLLNIMHLHVIVSDVNAAEILVADFTSVSQRRAALALAMILERLLLLELFSAAFADVQVTFSRDFFVCAFLMRLQTVFVGEYFVAISAGWK